MIVKTAKNKQILDITNLVQKELSKSKKESGFCLVFVSHTTAAITTADLDPGTDLDFLDFIEELTPDLDFRHPHDPDHAPDHIWSSIIGPSVSVPFLQGKLALGAWQRIVLIELNGPKNREVSISIL